MNPNGDDEPIKTIFVVGMPPDMKEREFQNMFIFAQGFEAATLRVQSSGGSDEYGTSSSSQQRRQTIGFAKFRTPAAAIEAREILSGKKVDTERGSVLKAELAKKNLYTRPAKHHDFGGGGGHNSGSNSHQLSTQHQAFYSGSQSGNNHGSGMVGFSYPHSASSQSNYIGHGGMNTVASNLYQNSVYGSGLSSSASLSASASASPASTGNSLSQNFASMSSLSDNSHHQALRSQAVNDPSVYRVMSPPAYSTMGGYPDQAYGPLRASNGGGGSAGGMPSKSANASLANFGYSGQSSASNSMTSSPFIGTSQMYGTSAGGNNTNSSAGSGSGNGTGNNNNNNNNSNNNNNNSSNNSNNNSSYALKARDLFNPQDSYADSRVFMPSSRSNSISRAPSPDPALIWGSSSSERSRVAAASTAGNGSTNSSSINANVAWGPSTSTSNAFSSSTSSSTPSLSRAASLAAIGSRGLATSQSSLSGANMANTTSGVNPNNYSALTSGDAAYQNHYGHEDDSYENNSNSYPYIHQSTAGNPYASSKSATSTYANNSPSISSSSVAGALSSSARTNTSFYPSYASSRSFEDLSSSSLGMEPCNYGGNTSSAGHALVPAQGHPSASSSFASSTLSSTGSGLSSSASASSGALGLFSTVTADASSGTSRSLFGNKSVESGSPYHPLFSASNGPTSSASTSSSSSSSSSSNTSSSSSVSASGGQAAAAAESYFYEPTSVNQNAKSSQYLQHSQYQQQQYKQAYGGHQHNQQQQQQQLLYQSQQTSSQQQYAIGGGDHMYSTVASVSGSSRANAFITSEPSNVIIISNLPGDLADDEVRNLLQNCDGFSRVLGRTKSTAGLHVHVEFEDIPTAAAAIHELQGLDVIDFPTGGLSCFFGPGSTQTAQKLAANAFTSAGAGSVANGRSHSSGFTSMNAFNTTSHHSILTESAGFSPFDMPPSAASSSGSASSPLSETNSTASSPPASHPPSYSGNMITPTSASSSSSCPLSISTSSSTSSSSSGPSSSSSVPSNFHPSLSEADSNRPISLSLAGGSITLGCSIADSPTATQFLSGAQSSQLQTTSTGSANPASFPGEPRLSKENRGDLAQTAH